MVDLLVRYPSVFFLSFIIEPLAGAAFSYGLVWVVMRPKAEKRMRKAVFWHSCGLAVTVIGSALFRVMAMVTFAGQSAYKPVASTGAMGFYMLIVPAIVAAVYIGLLKRHFTGIGAAPPHLDVLDSARREKGWRWFKLVAYMMLVVFGIKFIFALIGNDSLNRAVLAILGAVVGTIFFGGIAYFLGWLTGERKRQGTPPIMSPPVASTAADASAVDAIYEAIDEELKTDNLDRATWTRAQGDAEGNAERTKALYIKYRAQRLLTASRDEHSNKVPFDAVSMGKPAKKYSSRFMASTAGVLACVVIAVMVIGFVDKKPAPAKGGFVPLDLNPAKGGFEPLGQNLTKDEIRTWDEFVNSERGKDLNKFNQPGSAAEKAARFGLSLAEYQRRYARSSELCADNKGNDDYICRTDVITGIRR